MAKWVLAVSLLGFAALWLWREARATRSPAVIAASTTTSPPSASLLAPPQRTTAAIPATANAPTLAPEKLDINSAVLRNQLEEQIPRRLYAEAARCYHGGLQKDQRLDLSYRLHVVDGEISLSDLRTLEDTLEDSALERCIRERILATKWRDDALPDLDEDDDLYMRVGGFQSYIASAEPTQSADRR